MFSPAGQPALHGGRRSTYTGRVSRTGPVRERPTVRSGSERRAVKPGGRLAVADMAWESEPAESVRRDREALVGCIGGALVLDDYVTRLKHAGFGRVEVEKHSEAARKMVEVSGCVPPAGIEQLLSINITAIK